MKTKQPQQRAVKRKQTKTGKGPLNATPPTPEQISLIRDLLQNPAKYFDSLGLVGDPSYFLLLFVVMISCRRPKPLSITIAGGTSSGKSYPVKRISTTLIPSAWCELTARYSDAVMQRFPKDYFVHRMVLIEEECGKMPRAAYVIRLLQSEGSWIDHLVGKDGNPVKQELLGPISVVDTTSDDIQEIKEDNLTRVLVVQTDESQEQTRKITLKQAEEAVAGQLSVEPDFCAHVRDYLPKLKSLPVRIPFAKAIIPQQPRTQDRRDYPKMIHLIETIAYLRQFEKGTKVEHGVEFLEADLDDYEIAYPMLEKTFRAMRSDRSVVMQHYKDLVAKLPETKSPKSARKFNPQEFRRITGLGRARSSIVIRDLCEHGLIQCVTASRSNRPGCYAVVEGASASRSFLLLPKVLKAELKS